MSDEGASDTLSEVWLEDQRRRNRVLTSSAQTTLEAYWQAPKVIIFPSSIKHTLNSSTNVKVPSESAGSPPHHEYLSHTRARRRGIHTPTTQMQSASLSPVASKEVLLAVSPFPGRRATIVLQPFDKPWDGEECAAKETAYVQPMPLPCGFDEANGPEATERPDSGLHTQSFKSVTRAGGPYASLTYVMDEVAVPFSALLSILERAGFSPLPARRALLHTNWSLKWSKHPTRSDFSKIRVNAYQKLNHFPGTWRIGRKDALHRSMQQAHERWERYRESSGNGGRGFGDNLYPEAWVLPEDHDALEAALKGSENEGKLFIVKPSNSACGRGVFLLEGGKQAAVPSSGAHRVAAASTPTTTDRGRPSEGKLLVQRYMSNPYLVHGYKFDLRLYVVVTCYEPCRMYLYKEGLVRFATTPYYTSAPHAASHNEGQVTSIERLNAHLTNFTINKKSEDFVAEPNRLDPSADDDPTVKEGWASKWPLAALHEHMEKDGFSWGGTMSRVHDLLLKVFLSILPNVREELHNLSTPMSGPDTVKSAHTDGPDSSPANPPFTHRGVSSFFELFGVDVLLQHPSQVDVAEGGKPSLSPTIMEVNIMPSLSTHYTLLDQCIKSNFIADTLTLVGLTSMSLKPAPPTSQWHSSKAPLGNAYLDSLTDATAVEACCTAEEERLRGPHFHRLMPTSTSATEYKALLNGATGASTTSPSLDEVLSAWERWRIDPTSCI